MSATRPEPLSADEEALLRVLNPALRGLMHAMDEDLRREHGMPNVEYGVLMYLSESSERRMRLGELAALSFQSLSGMSRTVTRLEGLGYVRRAPSATDARSRDVALTEAGLARLEEVWPTHVGSVRRALIEPLAGEDLTRLAAALEKVAAATGFDTARH